MSPTIKMDRQELYELVWSKPVVQIAKDLGISDVAVGKICKKLNIPKPGLGYWAKMQHGHQTWKKALPKIKAGDPEIYTIRGSISTKDEVTNEVIEEQRIFESKETNKVVVKQSLRNPHQLVNQSISRLSAGGTDRNKRSGGGRQCLDISVGKDSVHRSLLIMDALIKALEKRGFLTSLNDNYTDTTSVKIHGEVIKFGIFETSRRVAKPGRKMSEKYDMSDPAWEYVPTGKVSLQIKEYYDGRKSISDGKTKRLEDCLNKFILLLVKASESIKIRRKEHEQWEKEYQEQAQREREVALKKQQEQKMLNQLFNNADSWNKCKLAREYIDAVTEKASGGDELNSWLDWANRLVEGIESKLLYPLKESQPSEA